MKEPTDKTSKPGSRSFGLDILRAAAITAVILHHEITLTRFPILDGMDGVCLFFVVSGFLIGRMYFQGSRKPSFTMLSFWMSRWWRTLPPYAAALLLYTIVRHTTGSIAAPQPSLPWYYGVFLQNYLGLTGFGVTWSLCVQEHFYLVVPLFGLAITRLLGRRWFGYLLPILFFLPVIFRDIPMLHGPEQYWFFRSHLRCEPLIAGVWLAFLAVDEPATMLRIRRIAPWCILPLPVIFYFVPYCQATWFKVTSDELIPLGFAACVCSLGDFGWKPATWFGRGVRWSVQLIALTSYSIYLVHTTVDPVLRGFATEVLHLQRGAARSLFVIAGVLVIGELFAYLIERPTILLRNRVMRHAPEQTLPSPVEPGVV